MSKELIERLLHRASCNAGFDDGDAFKEAADLIEAQQSWIDSLEQNARDADRMYKELETELAEQQKRIDELEMNLDACASECLGARQMATAYEEREKNLFNALMESTKLSDNLFSKGHKLAFVLECILLATDSDMAAISKYWDEAHAALEEWRK